MIPDETLQAISETLHLMSRNDLHAIAIDLLYSGFLNKEDMLLYSLEFDGYDFLKEASDYRMECLENRFTNLSEDFIASKVEQIRKEQGEY